MLLCPSGIQWSFINNSLHSQNSSRSAKGSSSLDRLYSRKIRKQLVHHKQVNVSHSNPPHPHPPSPHHTHTHTHLKQGLTNVSVMNENVNMWIFVRVSNVCCHKPAPWKGLSRANAFWSAYSNHALFIVAVKSVESKTESFGGANWEGEDTEQQRLLLQAAGGAGQAQTSHIQGEHVIMLWSVCSTKHSHMRRSNVNVWGLPREEGGWGLTAELEQFVQY